MTSSFLKYLCHGIAIIGIYSHEECHLDLRRISSWASARFIHAEVCGIDTVKKLIKFTDSSRPSMSYDVLSINIGITPKLGYAGHHSIIGMNITPVKPIDGFARRWDQIVSRVRDTALADSARNIFHVVVVGGGAGGVELSMAIHTRLHDELKKIEIDSSFLRFTIVNRGPAIMSNHNK